MIYADLGPDNGGILLNLSEGGLAIQGIQPLTREQSIHVGFRLPESGNWIETNGQIVWANESGKGGGVRFVDLSEGARQQIKEWLSLEASSGSFEEEIPIQHEAPETKHLESSSRLPEMTTQDTGSAAADALLREQLQDLAASVEAATVASEVTTPLVADASPRVVPPRESNDEVVLDSESALPRPEDLLESQVEEQHLPEKLLASKSRFTRIAVAGVSGCLGILAVVAGTAIMRSQPGRIAAVLQDMRTAIIGGRAPLSTGQSPTSTSSQTFQIEVVDANSKRWLLVYGANATTTKMKSKTPRGQAPSRSLAPPQQKEKIIQRQWTLQPPHMPERASTGADYAGEGSIKLPAAGLAGIVPPVGSVDPRGSLPKPAEPEKPSLPENMRRQGGNVQQPVLIHRVQPAYPPLAKQNRLEGEVRLRAIIGKDGVPRALVVVNGQPILAQAALDAIRQWRYKPGRLDGEPLDVETTIIVVFHLQQ